MEVLLAGYIFLVGAAFGSFALVLVDRLYSNRNWVRGRSACEACKHTLGPTDLIPLISWAMQRGKCRYCEAKIGLSYPMTELLTGVLFLGSYVFLPYELDSFVAFVQFVSWLLALVLMSALFVYDFRWKLLPTKLIIPTALLGLVHVLAGFWTTDDSALHYAFSVVASVLVGAGVFWGLYQVSKGKWIGDGDVRFGVVIGLFLADPLLAWTAIFVASVYGIVFTLLRRPKKKKKLSLQIPFGPFLILGLVTTYLFGSRLIDWYFDTILFI